MGLEDYVNAAVVLLDRGIDYLDDINALYFLLFSVLAGLAGAIASLVILRNVWIPTVKRWFSSAPPADEIVFPNGMYVSDRHGMHTFYVKTEYGGQGGEANLSGFEDAELLRDLAKADMPIYFQFQGALYQPVQVNKDVEVQKGRTERTGGCCGIGGREVRVPEKRVQVLRASHPKTGKEVKLRF